MTTLITAAKETITTLEKFEIGVFTVRTIVMFSVHNTPEKFENVVAGHFGFAVEGKVNFTEMTQGSLALITACPNLVIGPHKGCKIT